MDDRVRGCEQPAAAPAAGRSQQRELRFEEGVVMRESRAGPDESAHRRWENATTPWLTALAIISLTTFVVSEALRTSGALVLWIEYGIWAAFVTDYLVRLKLAPRHWEFVRSHPLDLAAVALPAIRVLRLIAMIGRIGMIARRGRAERLLVTGVALVLTLVVAGAAAVLSPERADPDGNITDYPDALWWAITTITTVGYGDLHPVTPEGRLVGAVLMIVGIGMMGLVSATIATRLILPDQQTEQRRDTEHLERRLEAIEAHLSVLTARLRDQAPPPAPLPEVKDPALTGAEVRRQESCNAQNPVAGSAADGSQGQRGR
ncbi:potassium channel family protein [Yinghuangia sp. YIM S10712]|uniref:potassium channel family protein n=1 Tax=Yinghuangia sp. YIM S10712 TaxID=3436930 RepID=UPI003F53B357